MITAIKIRTFLTRVSLLSSSIKPQKKSSSKKLEGWNLKLTRSSSGGRAMLKILWDVKIDFKDIGFLSLSVSHHSHKYIRYVSQKERD